MKKMYATKTLANGKEIQRPVWVDEETADVLATLDEEMRNKYLWMVRREYLLDWKERRRHISLTAAVDNGFDIVDESVNIEKAFADKERWQRFLSYFTHDQQWIIQKLLEGYSQKEIGKMLGIKKQSISDRVMRISKKIEKICEVTTDFLLFSCVIGGRVDEPEQINKDGNDDDNKGN